MRGSEVLFLGGYVMMTRNVRGSEVLFLGGSVRKKTRNMGGSVCLGSAAVLLSRDPVVSQSRKRVGR